MPRLFFAVNLPAGAAGWITKVQEVLRPALRAGKPSWSDPAQAHCTLKFLGEVRQERIALCSTAARALRGGVGPFVLSIGGLGAFPDTEHAKVIWAGVVLGSDGLDRLSVGLDESLAAIGFSREDRPYRPHVTLARLKAPIASRELSAAFAEARVPDLAPFPVEAFALLQSNSTPSGVRYDLVESFSLEAR